MDKQIIEFFKKKNNIAILIILIIGIVLLMVPSKGAEKPEQGEVQTNDEQRLAEIISSIKGVSDAEVMITYSSSEEKRLAYETRTGRNDRGSAGVEEDFNKAAIIANGEPVVLSKTYPKVKGVVVIAEGVGVTRVQQEVLTAVTTAFDIPPNKVCILEK